MHSFLRLIPVAAACFLFTACDETITLPPGPRPAPASESSSSEPAITPENVASEVDKLEKEIDAQ